MLPRLPRDQPRPDHGARGLRHGLQPRLRLHRPALPRPRPLLRLRPLRHRPPRRPGRRPRRRSRSPPASPPAASLAALARPPRAPHHRHRLHDRDADVRPGRLPRRSSTSAPITRGDEGFTLPRAARALGPLDLSADGPRYARRLRPLRRSASSPASRSSARPTGRVLVAVRENAERTRMLGYDPFRARLLALTLSGLYAGAAGAAYGLLFGYVGATFASVQYSILPLLWVLLGGAGTVARPARRHRADVLPPRPRHPRHRRHPPRRRRSRSSLLVLFAPRGLLGALRARAPAVAAVTLLEARGLTPQLRRPQGRRRRRPRPRRGRDPRAHRPERRRQDHARQPALRPPRCPTPARSGFDGRDITRLPAHVRVRLGIAYTFQITSIYPRLPVFDNVALAVQRRGAADLAAGDLRRPRPRRPRGPRRRDPPAPSPTATSACSRSPWASRSRPRLLILDEPTQGLAAGEIEAFKAARPRDRRAPPRVLLIEHNMDVVMDLAERITVLDFGRTPRHRHARRDPRRPGRPGRLPRPVMLDRRPTSTPATATSRSCAASRSPSRPARSSA